MLIIFFTPSRFVEVSEGVMKKVIVEGVGNPPSKGDFVSLHCVGYMDDTEPPTQFWNTKELGQRIFTFAVGKKQVIKGEYSFFSGEKYDDV